MCGACAGDRHKFDSIGMDVTGAPRPWPFHATDVRGVRGGALHTTTDQEETPQDEISLHTDGVRNQGTIIPRKGAGDGGGSQKLTCAVTALDSKSEKAIWRITTLARTELILSQ